MGKKKGHNRLVGIRRDIYLGHQIFQGFPHRRHKKEFIKNDFNKKDTIDKIRQKELEEEF
jgi:hypothetical protein